MTDTKWVKIILGDFSNDFQNYRVIKKRHPLLGRDDMVSWKDGHGIFKYNLFKYYLEKFMTCNKIFISERGNLENSIFLILTDFNDFGIISNVNLIVSSCLSR